MESYSFIMTPGGGGPVVASFKFLLKKPRLSSLRWMLSPPNTPIQTIQNPSLSQTGRGTTGGLQKFHHSNFHATRYSIRASCLQRVSSVPSLPYLITSLRSHSARRVHSSK